MTDLGVQEFGFDPLGGEDEAGKDAAVKGEESLILAAGFQERSLEWVVVRFPALDILADGDNAPGVGEGKLGSPNGGPDAIGVGKNAGVQFGAKSLASFGTRVVPAMLEEDLERGTFLAQFRERPGNFTEQGEN